MKAEAQATAPIPSWALKELAEVGVRFDNEGEPYNQSARELCERITVLEEALKASERLRDNNYIPWGSAGGVDECKHGYGRGLDCRRCDEDKVREVLASIRLT